VSGLRRVGSSEVYTYPDESPPQGLGTLLARYEAAGYPVERYEGGFVRVLSPGRRTVFVLASGPVYLALPPTPTPEAATGAPGQAQPITAPSLLVRAVGYRSLPELAAIEAALRRINPRLLPVLQSEFPGTEGLASLELLVEQRALLTRWPIEAVRGLAYMFQLERGIGRTTIRRLFAGLDEPRLIETLVHYASIAESERVAGATSAILDPELSPWSQSTLIEAVDRLRAGRLELRGTMDLRAARGLLRLVRDNPLTYANEVLRMPPEQRLDRLRRLDPVVDPRITRLPEVEAELAMHRVILPNGINLLHGTPEDVVRAVEQRLAVAASKGGFHDAAIRQEFVGLVQRYHDRVAQLQANDLGVRSNARGDRQELVDLVTAMESGAQVLSMGLKMRVVIDLATYELKPGIRVVNAPPEVEVQLDLGLHRADGSLLAVETTTGRLSLPENLAFLDPQSKLPAKDVDWSALDRNDFSQHKFMQAFKLYIFRRFSADLGRSWGNDPNAAGPGTEIRVGKCSAPARRALESLGFTLIETAP
jgi:hypothetical protein